MYKKLKILQKYPESFQNHLTTISKNNSFTRIFEQLSSVISRSKHISTNLKTNFQLHVDSMMTRSVIFLGGKKEEEKKQTRQYLHWPTNLSIFFGSDIMVKGEDKKYILLPLHRITRKCYI